MSETNIQIIALFVSQAVLWLSMSFLIVSQFRSLKIQADIIRAQSDMTALWARMASAGANVQVTNDWRALPPEAREDLRRAMLEVVAQIDAEGAVKH